MKYVRIIFSLSLIIYIVKKTDLAGFWGSFCRIPPALIIIFFLLNLFMVFLMACRWKLLLSSKALHLSVGELFNYYLVGIFFNNFIPGSVGGDIYRIMGMKKFPDKKEHIISSVILERLLGLFVLLPISAIGLFFFYNVAMNEPIIVLTETGLAFFLFSIFLFMNEKTVKSLSVVYNYIFSLLRRFDFKKKLKEIFYSLRGYFVKPVFLPFVLSFIARLIWIFSCYLVGRHIEGSPPFSVYLLVLPLIEFIRMFPISFNGIGVREGAFIIYFGVFGMAAPQALALCVVSYSAFYILGVFGGLFYGVNGWFLKKA